MAAPAHWFDRRLTKTLGFLLAAWWAPAAWSATALLLEAENGTLTGNAYVSAAVRGYSGSGYVTGLQEATDTIHWSFSADEGLYRMLIAFRAPHGAKGFEGSLNGTGFSGFFPLTTTFAQFDAGLVELKSGTNTLWLGGGWNWYEIDRVRLIPAPAPGPPLAVAPALCDPEATFAARALMAALAADYGRRTWTGQYETNEAAYIRSLSGRRPAILGFDFIDYSPSRAAYGARPSFPAEAGVALEQPGFIATISWHWNAPTNLLNTAEQPWWSGFYTRATTFDVAAALASTNSAEYALLLRDIDVIAAQLKKFADANVPVLWRPLHEADGAWFWWGAKGPEPFKALWRLLYQRLTGWHGLHNLIWVLSSPDPAWYPGDDVVDIFGVDQYPADPGDALASIWGELKTRFDGKKILALTEFGGVPDLERMQRLGVWWSYFVAWTGNLGPKGMPAATVTRIYQSPGAVTLEELQARPPVITDCQRAGAGLNLRGAGPRGAVFRVLASSSLAAPSGQWPEAAAQVFRGGVFDLVLPLPPNPGQMFYRLVTP